MMDPWSDPVIAALPPARSKVVTIPNPTSNPIAIFLLQCKYMLQSPNDVIVYRVLMSRDAGGTIGKEWRCCQTVEDQAAACPMTAWTTGMLSGSLS